MCAQPCWTPCCRPPVSWVASSSRAATVMSDLAASRHLATVTKLELLECANSPSELLQLAGRATGLRSLTIDQRGFDDDHFEDAPAEPAELDMAPITGLAQLTRLALQYEDVRG